MYKLSLCGGAVLHWSEEPQHTVSGLLHATRRKDARRKSQVQSLPVMKSDSEKKPMAYGQRHLLLLVAACHVEPALQSLAVALACIKKRTGNHGV